MESRCNPEKYAGGDRYDEREGQSSAVNSGAGEPRDLVGRKTGEHFRTPYSDRYTAGSARKRQHRTFDQELLHDAPATRSERRANCNFAPASGCTGEKKVGDVGARNQEH